MDIHSINTPNVAPEIRPTPYQPNAPAGAFGEDLAAGAQHLTNEAASLASRSRQEASQNAAMDAYSQYQDHALGLSDKFAELNGHAALEAHPAYVADLAAAKNKILAGLPSQTAQRLAMPNLEKLQRLEQTRIDVHAAGQRKFIDVQSYQSSLASDAAMLASRAKDPDYSPENVKDVLAHAHNVADQRADKLGFEGDAKDDFIAKQLRPLITGMLNSRTDSLNTSTDLKAVQQTRDEVKQYASMGLLLPGKTAQSLLTKLDDHEGRTLAGQVVDAATSSDKLRPDASLIEGALSKYAVDNPDSGVTERLNLHALALFKAKNTLANAELHQATTSLHQAVYGTGEVLPGAGSAKDIEILQRDGKYEAFQDQAKKEILRRNNQLDAATHKTWKANAEKADAYLLKLSPQDLASVKPGDLTQWAHDNLKGGFSPKVLPALEAKLVKLQATQQKGALQDLPTVGGYAREFTDASLGAAPHADKESMVNALTVSLHRWREAHPKDAANDAATREFLKSRTQLIDSVNPETGDKEVIPIWKNTIRAEAAFRASSTIPGTPAGPTVQVQQAAPAAQTAAKSTVTPVAPARPGRPVTRGSVTRYYNPITKKFEN